MSDLKIDNQRINESNQDLQQIESDRNIEFNQEDEDIIESSKSLQFIYDDDNSTDSLIEEKIKEFRLDHNDIHEDEDSAESTRMANDFELKIGKVQSSQMEYSSNNQRESFKEIEEEATEEEAATEEEHDDDEEVHNKYFKCLKNYGNIQQIRLKGSSMEQNTHENNVEEVFSKEKSSKENIKLNPDKSKDLGDRTLSLSKLKASLAVFQSTELGWISKNQDTLEEQILGDSNILKKNQEDISLSELFASKKELVLCQTSKYPQISTRTIPQDLSEREVRFLKKKSEKQHDNQVLVSNMNLQEKSLPNVVQNCYSNGFKDNSFKKNTSIQQDIVRNGKISENSPPEERYSQYLNTIHAANKEDYILSDQEHIIKETPRLKESNRTLSKHIIQSNGGTEFPGINSISVKKYVGNEENTFEYTMDLKLNGQRSNTSSLSPKYQKGYNNYNSQSSNNNNYGYVESKSTSAASCFLTSSQSNNNSQGTFSNFHFSSAANTGSIFLDNGWNNMTQTFMNNNNNNPRNLHHRHPHYSNYYISSSSSNKTMNVSSAVSNNTKGLVVHIKRNHNDNNVSNLNSSNTSDQSRSASKGRGFRRSSSRNNSFANCLSSATNSFELNSQKGYQKGRQLSYARGIIPDSQFNSRNSISPTQIQQQPSKSNRIQLKPQNRYPGNNNIFINKKNTSENRRKQHSLSQDGHTRSSTDDKIFYKLNVTSSYEYPIAETQPSIEPRTSMNDVFARNLLTSSLNLNNSNNNMQNNNISSNQDFNINSKVQNNHIASVSNFHGQTPIKTMLPNQNAYADMNGKFKRTAMIYLNSNSNFQKQTHSSQNKSEHLVDINQQASSLQSTIRQSSRTKIRVLLSAKQQQQTQAQINSRKSARTPEIDDVRNQHTLQTLPSAFSLAAEQQQYKQHHLSQGNRENSPEDYNHEEQIQSYLKSNSTMNNNPLQQQNYPTPPAVQQQQQQFLSNPFKLNKQQNIFSGRGGGGRGVLIVRSSVQPRKSSSTLHNYLKNDQNIFDYSINSFSNQGMAQHQQDITQNQQSYLNIQNPTTKSKSQFRTSSELRGRPPRRQGGGSVQLNIMGSNNNSFNNSSHNTSINHNGRQLNKPFSQDKQSKQIASMVYLQNKNNNANSDYLQFTSSVCERSSWKSPKQKKQKETNKRVLSQEDDRSFTRQAVY